MINLPLSGAQFSLEHAVEFREQLTAMLDGYHDRSTHGHGPNIYPRIGALTYAIRLIEDQIRTHAPDRAHAMGLFDLEVPRGGLFDLPADVASRVLAARQHVEGDLMRHQLASLADAAEERGLFDAAEEEAVVSDLAAAGINLRD